MKDLGVMVEFYGPDHYFLVPRDKLKEVERKFNPKIELEQEVNV